MSRGKERKVPKSDLLRGHAFRLECVLGAFPEKAYHKC